MNNTEALNELISRISAINALMNASGVLTIDVNGEILITEPAMREHLATGIFDGYERETSTYDGCEFLRISVGSVTVKAISVAGGKWN